MISYKDKTWCRETTCCQFSNCDRALTDKVYDEAKEWWNRGTDNNDEPIFSCYLDRPNCYKEDK